MKKKKRTPLFLLLERKVINILKKENGRKICTNVVNVGIDSRRRKWQKK